MKRRNFFKAFAALAATVVVAPSVIAKMKPEARDITYTSEVDWAGDVDFDDYLNSMTKYQPGEKIMYVGPDLYNQLNKHAEEVSNNLGISLTQIRTVHGSYKVISTPYLDKEVLFMNTPKSFTGGLRGFIGGGK